MTSKHTWGSFQVSLSQKLVKLSSCEIGLLYHCVKKKKYFLQPKRKKKKRKRKEKQVKKGFILACQCRYILFFFFYLTSFLFFSFLILFYLCLDFYINITFPEHAQILFSHSLIRFLYASLFIFLYTFHLFIFQEFFNIRI